ncbi:protein kinase [Actinosynnema sp. NPDC020468]|uniref:serine/threonine-protein kinase n=1 Tax=Actinosynnema sp. NPDC020468 TaxID=3154488 RepID=UPI0033E2F041
MDRTVAGRYRLTEKIGSGGMGVVWRAEDTRLRRVVAVKELLLREGFDEEGAKRAVREGRIAARLQHPNVIALYDVVEDEGHPWLVMEYLPSRSLATLLRDNGVMSPEEVRRLGAQLAEGLAAAHRAGVVHRDVKPANVLVTEFGTVKVTDFGTSRAADEVTVTASGLLVGTPAYLAPEVAKGAPADFPADVFGLGATLYTALEGEPPFGTDTNAIALLHKVAEGKYPPPVNAGDLEPVLVRLLDTDPDTRPTMPEAVRMLSEVSVDPGTVVGSAPVSPQTKVLPSWVSTPDPVAKPATVAEPVEAEPVAPPAAPEPEPEPVEPVEAAPPAAADPESAKFFAWTAEQPAPVAEPEPSPEPAPAAVPPPAGPPADEDPKRKWFALAALVLVMIVVGTVAFLITRGEKDSPTGTATGTSQQPTSPVAQGDPNQSSAAQPTTTTTAAEAPTTTTAAPTTTTAPPADAGGPEEGLADYYALVPGDLQTGYSRLTDRFKSARARSFEDYRTYWSQFSSVTLSDIQVVGTNRVSATLTYSTGQTERNTYQLVKNGDVWMIDVQE